MRTARTSSSATTATACGPERGPDGLHRQLHLRLGRQPLELTDASGNPIVQYTYAAAGNLIQKDNGNGTYTTYTYDADGNVASINNYAPSGAVNSFDNYTYDALGNVLTDTSQDGEWVYSYDADSELTQAVFTPNATDPDGLPSERPAVRLRCGRQPAFRDGQRRDDDLRRQRHEPVHQQHDQRGRHKLRVPLSVSTGRHGFLGRFAGVGARAPAGSTLHIAQWLPDSGLPSGCRPEIELVSRRSTVETAIYVPFQVRRKRSASLAFGGVDRAGPRTWPSPPACPGTGTKPNSFNTV